VAILINVVSHAVFLIFIIDDIEFQLSNASRLHEDFTVFKFNSAVAINIVSDTFVLKSRLNKKFVYQFFFSAFIQENGAVVFENNSAILVDQVTDIVNDCGLNRQQHVFQFIVSSFLENNCTILVCNKAIIVHKVRNIINYVSSREVLNDPFLEFGLTTVFKDNSSIRVSDMAIFVDSEVQVVVDVSSVAHIVEQALGASSLANDVVILVDNLARLEDVVSDAVDCLLLRFVDLLLEFFDKFRLTSRGKNNFAIFSGDFTIIVN